MQPPGNSSGISELTLESHKKYELLFNRFPRGEQALRGISATKHEETIFVTKVYEIDGRRKTFITVPKNSEQFADSSFMLSLFAIIRGLGFEVMESTKEVPSKVLTSHMGEWFVGYVNAWLDSTQVTNAEKGSSKYCKGYFSYQSLAVKASFGSTNLDHLKLSSDTPGALLAKMENFTKEWWGLRAQLASLFKAIAPTKHSVNLSTFLRSAQDLQNKKIRSSLPYENGGVFTPNEIKLLKSQSTNEVSVIESTKLRLNVRDEALALTFEDQLSSYRKAMKAVDDRAKPIIALRAPILFPKSKKKSDVLWSKKKLDEKLILVEEEKLRPFSPRQFDSRITREPSDDIVSNNVSISDINLRDAYGIRGDLSPELTAVLQDYISLLRDRAD